MSNANQPVFLISILNLWGLTKREEFAKAAMQGLIASEADGCYQSAAKIAVDAVKCADALLAELEKKKE